MLQIPIVDWIQLLVYIVHLYNCPIHLSSLHQINLSLPGWSNDGETNLDRRFSLARNYGLGVTVCVGEGGGARRGGRSHLE